MEKILTERIKGREEKEKPAKGELEKGIDNLYCLRLFWLSQNHL